MTKIPTSKKTVCFILVIIFLGLFLVNIEEAKAFSLEKAAKDILQGLFYILLQIARLFTGLVAKLFTAVLDFGFKDMTMVYTGWIITRDIVNMFFILALVAIAFATILRIETYGMKALLPKLIMVALFINFSYLLCGIIVDASQIMTTHFINQIQTNDIGAAVLDSLKVMDSTIGEEGQSVAISYRDPDTTTIVNMAFSVAIMFTAGFVLLIGAILLFIRVGALWALIIFAPFAWFFSIFPKLSTQTSKWWSEFLKWTFFAPIYVFFIYLVLTISKEIARLNVMGDTPETLQAMSLTAMTSNWNIFFNYVFLVILLFGAPTIAMSMGIQGTGVAKSIVKGGLKGAYKLPGRLRKAMVTPPGLMKAILPKKLTTGISNVAKWTSPDFWKQAMEERKREQMREARVPLVLGKQQDLLNRVLSLGQKKTTHAERAEEFEVQEREKEMLLDTKGVESALFVKFQDAHKRKDVVDMKSAIRLLVKDKNHNDLMLFTDMFDKMTYSDSELVDKDIRGKRVNPLGDAATEEERREGREYSDPGFRDLMYQLFAQAGEKESGAAAFMGALGEIGMRAGAYPLYNGGKMDGKGNWRRPSDEEQAKDWSAKHASVTLRDKGRHEHGSTFGTQQWDWKNNRYKFGKLTDGARKTFKGISPGDAEQKRFYEMRDDSVRGLTAAIKQLRKEMADPKTKDLYVDWTPEEIEVVHTLEKRIDDHWKGKAEKEAEKGKGKTKKTKEKA